MPDPPTLTALLTAAQIRDRVRELAADINDRYSAGQDLHLVAVLKGSFIFLADLVRALDRPITLDFVAVSSYDSGTRSSGSVTLVKDLDVGITDRDVLVVEDIVDTGVTLSWLLDTFRARQPRSRPQRSVRTLSCWNARARARRRHALPLVVSLAGCSRSSA